MWNILFLYICPCMTNPAIKITLCLLLFLALACSGKGKNGSAPEAEEGNPAAVLHRHLKGKADSALLYCRENKMNTEFCILVNMKIHSGKNRFFVWNFLKDSIMASSLCAHGYGMESTGSTPVFSNVPGSYCTSLGKYKTGARSYSKFGINVHYKLHGQEATNDKAYERIIVLHSFEYVPSVEIYPFHLPMGYSQGCPVIDNETMTHLDTLFKKAPKPTLLWVYFE